MGTAEEKRLHGRPRCRWEDNIKIILKIQVGSDWTGLNWLRAGQVASCCQHGNEPSDSIKLREYLDQLRNY